MRRLLATTTFLLTCGPLWADDAALLLGVERYTTLDRVVQGAAPAQTGVVLEQAGYDVFAGANSDVRAARLLAEGFQEAASMGDRMVVALSGRFATDGVRTWFLASDADIPRLFGVAQDGISVETVMGLLAASPGQAVLLLGQAAGDDAAYDGALRGGIGALDIPQGVTVITGRPRAMADLLDRVIATPGVDLLREARRTRGVRIDGYAPQALVLTGQQAVADAPAPANNDLRAEETAWAQAEAQDSPQGYLSFLGQYSNGPRADMARERLNAIRNEPNRAARLSEEALQLGRDARRAIQRDLNVLDYDTRGIDGIFGSGTRRAVTNWQQQNGFAQTGYLDAEQVARLDGQAARRSAELEAEAARQRAAEERRDRAYWEETGGTGTEAGYRAYLQRYPDGLFAGQAGERLQQIADANRQQAQAEDRAAWDRASDRNTTAAYRTYLDQFPNGRFAAEAQSRIQSSQQSNANAANRRQAEAEEQALGLDPIALRLVEARLQQLGLEPGTIDGRFDKQSRRAIRRYQRDRDLDRTGYLNQATVSRLLRDAFQ